MKLRDRISLAWRVLRASGSSNLYRHAETEMLLRCPDDPTDDLSDRMNKSMRAAVLDMVLVFCTEGHSGFSANYTVGCLQKVLRYEPLTPLTGDDDEWNEIGGFADGGRAMWQNKRCSKIFKEIVNGRVECYNIEGYVFEEPSGARFTGYGSRRTVAFPHSPNEPIIVKVDEEGVPILAKYKRLRERPTAVELVE